MPEVKERPILFSAPMVRAILEGRKSMTRRVVKQQPGPTTVSYTELSPGHFKPIRSMRDFVGDIGSEDHIRACDEFWADEKNETLICPYGQLRDGLWVREAWRVGAWAEEEGKIAVDYKVDGFCRREWLIVPDENVFARLWEQSTLEAQEALGVQERYSWAPGDSPCRWRSSRFMPRWASRITLEITSLRVERVQDISAHDAILEGVSIEGSGMIDACDIASQARNRYRELWDSLNAKRGYSWDSNPWVWVIEFKRIKDERRKA